MTDSGGRPSHRAARANGTAQQLLLHPRGIRPRAVRDAQHPMPRIRCRHPVPASGARLTALRRNT